MLIPISQLSKLWRITPDLVVHVGGHKGEENAAYSKFQWGNRIWIDAQPQRILDMKQSLDSRFNTIIEAAIWGNSGEKKKFNISSNSESSSLLELGTHAQSYPTIHFTEVFEVTTKTLDDIFIENRIRAQKIFLNLDIQGAELEALKGSESLLKNVHFIYTEVNKEEVYRGCAKVEEIDNFLKQRGFVRVATRWIIRAGWGDALYMKESDRLRTILSRMLSGNFYVRQIVARGYQKVRRSLIQSKPNEVGNENG